MKGAQMEIDADSAEREFRRLDDDTTTQNQDIYVNVNVNIWSICPQSYEFNKHL